MMVGVPLSAGSELGSPTFQGAFFSLDPPVGNSQR